MKNISNSATDLSPALQADLSNLLISAANAIAMEKNGLDASRLEVWIRQLQGAVPRRHGTESEFGSLGDWAANLPETPASVYVRARIASDAGDWQSAAPAWNRLFELHQSRDPDWVFQQARALAECGRSEEAIAALRPALTPPPKYSLLARAEKLIRRLSEADHTNLREAKIAFLGSYTTGMLIPVFQALAFRDRLRAATYAGLYGSTDVEILDPHSKLGDFKPDIVFLLDTWRNLKLPPSVENEERFIDDLMRTYVSRWKQLADRFNCHVVQCSFDFPEEESYGYLASALPGGRTRLLEQLNLRLKSEAPAHVSILDAAAVQRQVGNAGWQDSASWYSFQQHPSMQALPALADVMMAHVRAVLGLTRKVLVTDLDNTLWGGVIGEAGLSGIKLGPGSHQGEAHACLQSYLLELKTRGILLAVASKNNYADAVLPFQQHKHTVLHLEDFAAFEANWNDKASSIREIARKLNLGLDSFVFLDDNPVEREWVRNQLPQVRIVELGPTVYSYVRDLDRPQYFFSLALSEEDRVRSEQYRTEAARKNIEASSQTLAEFLSNLQLRASCDAVTEENLLRVTQLTNKTNQFNLTTRRYSQAQVEALAADPTCWTAAFHLADRMGDYGLIGLIFCRPAETGSWEIDTWLMSCRVLGREMEKFMFDRMIEAAQERGIREIHAVFRRTEKNVLVEEHYDRLGFQRTSDTQNERRYLLAVSSAPTQTATHIRNQSAQAASAKAT